MTFLLRTVLRQTACLAALLWCATAQAQEASDTQVFDRAYFAKYDVVNAEDMLIRVPGTQSVLDSLGGGQKERGFGSGGDQVLLNGKRFAGKGQVLNALRRIQAEKVARIELIRGNTGDANVLSEGLIINVVLVEGASTGSGSWQAGLRVNDRERVKPDGLVSYSDSWGALDYMIGLERTIWGPPGGGRPNPHNKTKIETYFYPGGSVRESRVQEFILHQHKYIATSNLAYNFASGAKFRLNGLFETRDVFEDEDTAFTRFDAAGNPTLQAIDLSRTHFDWEKTYEVGGDYEATVGGGALNILFIHHDETDPTIALRNINQNGRITELSRNITVEHNIESIVRGSITWPIFTGHTLEVGGESARNTLHQTLRPFLDRNADGLVEEIAIPTGNARVKELRGEAFANHTWQIGPDLSLSSSINVEASRISNNFPFSPSHTYVFPKPRADLRYDFTPTDQIRFKVERIVGQLDFTNFVPEFDIIDSEIDAGNPDIRPEREWEFEVTYQKQLPSNQGLLEGRVFYRDIQDHIDKLILRIEPDGTRVSADGNIGGGKHYGFETIASVRLTALGLPDFVIDARYLRHYSRTTDPFTGLRRRIGRSENGGEHWNYTLDVGFRHDITAWGLSYGMTYDERNGELISSDIRVTEFESQSPRIEAFVEKKLFGGLTLRAEGWGLIPKRSREYQRRTVYSDDVIRGTVSRREFFEDRLDRLFKISLRGTF